MSRTHTREPLHHVEDDRRGRLRELVFGLQDGMVSTLGVVIGIASATGDRILVVLSGLVVIVVESLSMGAGSYLGAKSEAEYEARILAEELEEIRSHPEKERRELFEFYEARGYTEEEQGILVERMMSDEDLLLEEMAHKELGIFPGREPDTLRNASVMFVAYILGGLAPLLPFLIVPDAVHAIPIAFVTTALVLFLVGAKKGSLVGVSPGRSGLEMMLIGMGAAILGLLVGTAAGHLLGLDPLAL